METEMKEKLKGMVLGAFLADSLALGAHWIYDTEVIDREFGRIDALKKPLPGSYHPNRQAGEFTHYGDQTLWLLESVCRKKTFDLDDFGRSWQEGCTDYTGYVDGATKAALKAFASGAGPAESGSGSDDLSAASRIAPVAFACWPNLAEMVSAARAQAAMTHDNPKVLDGAEFLARVLFGVLQGTAPVTAIREVAAGALDREPLSNWVADGLDSIGADTRKTIARFGPMCRIDAGFPGVIHLIAKYEGDFKAAMVENVMAGGDSAARGLAAGMILGAHLGMEALPEEWLSFLVAGEKISALLASAPG